MQKSDRAYADDTRRFKLNSAITSARKADDRSQAYALLTAPDVLEALCELDDDQIFTGVANEMELVSAEKKCSMQIRRVLRDARSARARKKRDYTANKSELSEYPKEITRDILTGRFMLTDGGVMVKETGKDGVEKTEHVCFHPIMPVKILENVEDDAHRVELAYYKHAWRYITVKRSTIASRQAIVQLSEYGIDVTSESAGKLVDFLSVCEAQNGAILPRVKSVGHLGWVRRKSKIGANESVLEPSQQSEPSEFENRAEGRPVIGDDFEFAPFYGAIQYGGDENYKDLFNAVTSAGDYGKWLECAKIARSKGGPPKIALAASFAAPLIKIIGGLCFCVHIWGSTGTGKTVSLLQSASVWGDPGEGRFMRSLSGTSVGLESTAAFMGSLPLCLNEQQSAKDWSDLSAIVYMLCEGQSKPRGRRDGGLRKGESWNTIMITNGEMPLTSTNSGAGAINRVVSIECAGDLYDDPVSVAETVRSNYGFAGKDFIGRLLEMSADELRRRYKDCCAKIANRSGVTDKQRLSAGYILLADELATEWIFKDENGLKPYELAKHLATTEDVSSFRRAYDLVAGWIAANRAHFDDDAELPVEIYGKPFKGDEKYMCIMTHKLNELLKREGFSSRAFLSDADAAGLLMPGQDKRTRMIRFGDDTARCAVLNMRARDEDDDLPF